MRTTCNLLTVFLTIFFAATSDAQLLTNGDFELPAILGTGQTGPNANSEKGIVTSSAEPNYSSAISGINSWTYGTPNQSGTASDHGLALRNAIFGLDPAGQSVYINNWGRMMSQTVSPAIAENDLVTASINFGTRGSDMDTGRAGTFYLVAGEADPVNPDMFSSRSIVLDELTVANTTWSAFTPDFAIGINQFVQLNLAYQYQTNDAALGLPLTIGFRTESGSAGPTYWDDASLTVTPVPEPNVLSSILILAVLAKIRRKRAIGQI